MRPYPEGMTKCPLDCEPDAGWDYSDHDARWCDHGAEQAKAAAAELRDRIIAERRRRATSG